MPSRTRLHQHSRQARSRGRPGPLGYLAGLALIWAYAVVQKGATAQRDWLYCLLAVGALTLLYWLRTPKNQLAPALSSASHTPHSALSHCSEKSLPSIPME